LRDRAYEIKPESRAKPPPIVCPTAATSASPTDAPAMSSRTVKPALPRWENPTTQSRSSTETTGSPPILRRPDRGPCRLREETSTSDRPSRRNLELDHVIAQPARQANRLPVPPPSVIPSKRKRRSTDMGVNGLEAPNFYFLPVRMRSCRPDDGGWFAVRRATGLGRMLRESFRPPAKTINPSLPPGAVKNCFEARSPGFQPS